MNGKRLVSPLLWEALGSFAWVVFWIRSIQTTTRTTTTTKRGQRLRFGMVPIPFLYETWSSETRNAAVPRRTFPEQTSRRKHVYIICCSCDCVHVLVGALDSIDPLPCSKDCVHCGICMECCTILPWTRPLLKCKAGGGFFGTMKHGPPSWTSTHVVILTLHSYRSPSSSTKRIPKVSFWESGARF